MKLTTLLLVIAIVQVSASALAQKVTLSESKAGLEAVFNKISQQTGYDFLFNNSILKTAKPISIQVEGAELADVLAQIFERQPLKFTIKEQTVIVSRKSESEANIPTLMQLMQQQQTITGRVTDSLGNPLENATVRVKGTNRATFTDKNGEFTLRGVENDAVLQISYLGFTTRELAASGPIGTIVLYRVNAQLEEAEVVVNSGYQTLPKERATGSFDQIDNQLLNRAVSTNILDRLEGVASGVIFNKNRRPGENTSAIAIRGRSTIQGNTSPLVVLDNFAYDGDLSNINPNNIESITILKDAAAASIWGARAANGVIVLTSKKGRYEQKPLITFNTNVSVTGKPDPFYQPQMRSADYIDVEKYLYGNGFYTSRINSAYLSLSPVVDLLNQQAKGQITQSQLDDNLAQLAGQDIRNDQLKYVYRSQVNQQYALNVNGGSENDRYFFSAGYDKNISNLVGIGNDRLTITGNNTYRFFKNKLELNTDLQFTSTKADATGGALTGYAPGQIGVYYPYTRIADAQGHALPIYPYYRKSYVDTIGQGQLLDWTYRPLDEIGHQDNKTTRTDYRMSFGLKYNIIKSLNATVNYVYQKGVTDNRNLHDQSSYYTRDLINKFTKPNYATGIPALAIPLGDILDVSNSTYSSNNIRGQLNFDHTWGRHSLVAIAGAEVKDYQTSLSANTAYGYDDDIATTGLVDYATQSPTLPLGLNSPIPYGTSFQRTIDRYVSTYANAAYTYNEKYTLSASARKDESNLFGVNANQKGVPLWSIGAGWLASKESFYTSSLIPYLKLRTTIGYNGNVNKTVSAFTTARVVGHNSLALYSQIQNPPNPELRWEKVRVINIAADFASKNDVLKGSIEFYRKDGTDIIGNSPIAPQTGLTTYTGNNAGIRSKGIDLTLNANLLKGPFGWQANLLYSYSIDKITTYKNQIGQISAYMNGNFTDPLEGYVDGALFSYKWAGLEPQTGNPQGYINGAVSTDYTNLVNPASFDEVVYTGPSRATSFGSLRNTFSYKSVSLSVLLNYQFGFYFRRPSIGYYDLYQGTLTTGSAGNADYALRWQKPGDELTTNVPSMIYPLSNANRDNFYQNSETLVEKGDHIRLQDIQLGYDLGGAVLHKLGLKTLKVYAYAENLGIIWKAAKGNIDPVYTTLTPPATSLALGLTSSF